MEVLVLNSPIVREAPIALIAERLPEEAFKIPKNVEQKTSCPNQSALSQHPSPRRLEILNPLTTAFVIIAVSMHLTVPVMMGVLSQTTPNVQQVLIALIVVHLIVEREETRRIVVWLFNCKGAPLM